MGLKPYRNTIIMNVSGQGRAAIPKVGVYYRRIQQSKDAFLTCSLPLVLFGNLHCSPQFRTVHHYPSSATGAFVLRFTPPQSISGYGRILIRCIPFGLKSQLLYLKIIVFSTQKFR